MKKLLSLICFLALVLYIPLSAYAAESTPFDVNAESAVLMEAKTGRVLYEKNPDKPLPPASVTKIMTLLLVCEAVDRGEASLSDSVRVSEYAASMGGSQIYLEPNEEMKLSDLLKSVVVSSANDGAVALAEHIAGDEGAFVEKMNIRARELGMKNTSFENTTGLDDDTVKHLTSARDIAIMSRELITKHPMILDYSSIWMDTVRNGEFTLTNTNRLIRFYKGATGLKTGSTSKAGFCISATAERDGMHLIAVIMGSKTRDERNSAATKLLDMGFSKYALYEREGKAEGEVKVLGGTALSVKGISGDFSVVVQKGDSDVSEETQLYEKVTAPVSKGDVIGKVTVKSGDGTVAEIDICAAESVKKSNFLHIVAQLLKKYFMIS